MKKLKDLNRDYTRRVYREIRELSASLEETSKIIKCCETDFVWMDKESFDKLCWYVPYFHKKMGEIKEILDKLGELNKEYNFF